jgi:hypothetical protein
VQSPEPDPEPDDPSGAEATGTGELTPAVPVDVLVPQAARDRAAAMATVSRGNDRRDMTSSRLRDGSFGVSSIVYVGTTRAVSVGPAI